MHLDAIGNNTLTKTSTHRLPALISACLVILLSGLAVGCGSDGDSGSSDPSSAEPAEVETATPAPDSPPADGAPVADAEQPSAAAPQSTPEANVQGEDVLCSTPSQTAQVTWQEGEPRLSIMRKPDQAILDQASPVAIQRNDDSSVTYGYLQGMTAYIKTLSDGNCMVQILDAQGSVTVEEYGRTSQG